MYPENSFLEGHQAFVNLALLKPSLEKTLLDGSTGACHLRKLFLLLWRFAWMAFWGFCSLAPRPQDANSYAALALPKVEALGGNKAKHKTAGEEGRLFLLIHEVLKSSELKSFQTMSLPASC